MNPRLPVRRHNRVCPKGTSSPIHKRLFPSDTPIYLDSHCICVPRPKRPIRKRHMLPIKVLQFVFKHLEAEDFVNLSLVSKAYNELAVAQIYRRLVSTGGAGRSYFLVHEFQVKPYHLRATVVSAEQVSPLLYSLSENTKLGGLIESVVVPFYIEQVAEILWIEELLMYTQPTIFFFSGKFLYPPKTLRNVQRLSCAIFNFPQITHHLTELSLTSTGSRTDGNQFQKLAQFMVDSKSYFNLRKLAIESDRHKFPRPISPNSQKHLGQFQRTWIKFFRVLSENHIMLNLSALVLDINGDISVRDESNFISQAVNISQLHTLELYCERMHECDVSATHPTILECLAPHFPRLEHLSISCGTCFTFDEESTRRTLQFHIPHQLKTLHIHDYFVAHSVMGSLQAAILKFQNQLTYLKLNITSEINFGLPIQSLSETCLRYCSTRLQLNCNAALRTSLSFLQSEQTVAYVPRDLVRMITSSKSRLHQLLNSDMVYLNAADDLPQLVQYCFHGFLVDMKKGGIVLNGNFLRL